MKAYVTSIGERTTKLCCEQLTMFGFEVVLLDKQESWHKKYKRFLREANEDCIRIDADIIPNKRIEAVHTYVDSDYLMVQFKTYGFYRNDISITSPVFYKKDCFKILNGMDLDENRPETSAWRNKYINMRTHTSDVIVGLHGFFQDKETMERAYKNKVERKQLDMYDFELARKVAKL